jgi:predicted RNase H-like nuclease (RuvC/YqgF family)
MRFFAVLAALIVPLAAYYPVKQEREKTIETQEKQIKELDMHIEQAKAAERKLAQFHEEVQRLNEEVAKSRRILPIRRSTKSAMSSMESPKRPAFASTDFSRVRRSGTSTSKCRSTLRRREASRHLHHFSMHCATKRASSTPPMSLWRRGARDF